jgi:hypothetical protein
MSQALEELVSSLRKTIDKAMRSSAFEEHENRALRRALALLWSAHDEIAALQSLRRRQA